MIDLVLKENLSYSEMIALESTLREKSLSDFMAEWHKHLWQVWALNGPDLQMLVVTAVHEEETGRELFLYKILGKGWIKQMDLIKQVFFVIAREAGAKALSGAVSSRALARLYERLGAEHVSLNIYRLELPNG